MSKLVITGKRAYTKRMYKHLKKEHPSTKHRMILRDRCDTINYCEMCGKRTKKVSKNIRKINICKTCLNKELGKKIPTSTYNQQIKMFGY